MKIEKEQRKTKWCVWLATILYLFLFPVLCWIVYPAVMVLQPGTFVWQAYAFVFLAFLIPLSIIPGLFLIWSRYRRGQYRKTRWMCLFPIGMMVILFFLIELLR